MFADSVHLGVAGNLYGEMPVGVGGQLVEGFALNQATNISSFQVGILDEVFGNSGGNFLFSLIGPGGTYWTETNTSAESFPATLPAGQYEMVLTGLSCNLPCVTGQVAEWDPYAAPEILYETGGSVLPYYDVGLGFDLTGTTTPEPGTGTLLGSGLLVCAIAGLVRRRRDTDSQSVAQ